MRKFDGLVLLLDAQIEHLQGKLSVTGQMADCIRRGDGDALDELLQQQAELEAGAESLERRIMRARDEIAAGLAVPAQVERDHLATFVMFA